MFEAIKGSDLTSRHTKMTSQIMLLNVPSGLKAKDVPRYTILSSIDVINGFLFLFIMISIISILSLCWCQGRHCWELNMFCPFALNTILT